jgi:hypothetical protein
MMCQHPLQGCRTTLLVATLIMRAVPGDAAEAMYHFTDEHGVPHFSNLPLDPRYRLLVPTESEAAPAEPAAEVDIDAPDQAVLGDMFEISVSMDKVQRAATGYLELSFDPEALSLQAISVDANLTEPGKVRIDLSVAGGEPKLTLVNLSFQAVAPAPTRASVQVTQLDLFGPEGDRVPVHQGAWANVELVQ